MPSGKTRTKEDTWKEDDLKRAIKGKDEGRHRSERRRNHDDDKGSSRHARKEEDGQVGDDKRKERHDRPEHRDKHREAREGREHESKKDRDERHRSRENRHDRKIRQTKDDYGEDAKHDRDRKKKDDNEERHRERKRDGKDADRERKHRDDKGDSHDRHRSSRSTANNQDDSERKLESSRRHKEDNHSIERPERHPRPSEDKEARDRRRDRDRKYREKEQKKQSEELKDDHRPRHRIERPSHEGVDRQDKDRSRDRRRHHSKEGGSEIQDKENRDEDKERHRRHETEEEREEHRRRRKEETEEEKEERRRRRKEETEEERAERRRRRHEREQADEEKDEHRRRRKDETEEEREERRRKRREEREREKEHIHEGEDHRHRNRNEQPEGEAIEDYTKHKDRPDRPKEAGSKRTIITEKERRAYMALNDSDDQKTDKEKELRIKEREKAMLKQLKKEERKKDILTTDLKFHTTSAESADVVDDEESAPKAASAVSAAEAKNLLQDSDLQTFGKNGQQEPQDNYEDDFEDYEDDFEEDGDEDVDEDLREVMQAMRKENESLNRTTADEIIESKTTEKEARPTKGFINFTAAKQRTLNAKVAEKTKKRGKELLKLIDLDSVGFNMFELEPLNEYSLYMKSFGRTNTDQAYVQCGDDNLDQEIQTEDITTTDRWVQFPAEGTLSHGASQTRNNDDLFSDSEAIVMQNDSLKLSQFLQSAGHVCAALLEEEDAYRQGKRVQTTNIGSQVQTQVSGDIFTCGSKLSFLQGRPISRMQFLHNQTHLLLTLHQPAANPVSVKSAITSDMSFICLWNINEPSQPQKVLISDDMPNCCCMSPQKASLAFAGTMDGAVLVWDLRETSSLHKSFTIDGVDWYLRHPTYSTNGTLQDTNHHSPVVSILPLVSLDNNVKNSNATSKNNDESSGLSFQLASLEREGTINIWVVVEISRPDLAGSTVDLGLLPGGRVKLLKTSWINIKIPLTQSLVMPTSISTLGLQLAPSDPNHFYIVTDMGTVIHDVRSGSRPSIRLHRSKYASPCEVVSIEFSPFLQSFFIIGCNDCTVRLYNTATDELAYYDRLRCIDLPLLTLRTKKAVVNASWSRSRPSVIYAVDENSTFYVWITTFVLSNDVAASGLGTPGRPPQMAISYDSGRMEIHTFNTRFGSPVENELQNLESYFNKIVI
ncbi:WD repeat-containing protein 60 [Trichoplax sp. H2]|nr:WD repeat-containing protein 60 [Trichoplax sp. H2]|eukprot:RDD40781.1 WD repeat-containing protein 60 [Trichoplax sp. H2]